MKSIWFFVGLTLTIMGVLVVVAGIADYMAPPERSTVLAATHPALWWDGVMVVAGVVFLIRERRQQ